MDEFSRSRDKHFEEALVNEHQETGLCRKITNLGHQMFGYIEREQGNISMGETVQYSNQLINNWARARRYRYKRARRHKRKGPAGIRLNREPVG